MNIQDMEYKLYQDCNTNVKTQPLLYQSIYNFFSGKWGTKEGVSDINYTEIFQSAKALEISVGKIYTEDQLRHTFLENLQKVGK